MKKLIIVLMVLALAAPVYAADADMMAAARSYRGNTDYREEFNKCADKLVNLAVEQRECQEILQEKKTYEMFLWTVIGMFIVFEVNR